MVQKLLGHREPRMTQRYSHLADSRMKEAAEAAAKAVDEQAALAEDEAKKKESRSRQTAG